ncbi:MAG: hypothetical protein CVU50_03720 [Candidatus Cloacimonetes bacterium HGW-Cloacimonetes-3]|nr:MAG: hypothetical protein CVU50_03720 [Candidatus Cloacimonetes bacterium HGW-Cloacimonetes-3]
MAKTHQLARLILGVYCFICPLFLHGWESADSLSTQRAYSGFQAWDYYHLATEGDYHQYLYSTSFHAGWERLERGSSYKAEYRNYRLSGKYSEYPNTKDYIDLSMPDEHLLICYSWHPDKLSIAPYLQLGSNKGIGLKLTHRNSNIFYTFDSSTKEGNAELSYNIKGETGNIPFAWNTSLAKISFGNSRLNASLLASTISPSSCDSLFYNAIHSSTVKTELSYRAPLGIDTSIAASYTDTDAELYYKDGKYGDFQNFRVLIANAGLHKQLSHFNYDLLFDAYFSGIGSDSYVDIWPFTYLDTFLSHRTRIKQLAIESLTPGIEAGYRSSPLPVAGFNWQVSLAYHHLFHKEDIIIRNRKVVLYPFLFTYDTNHYNWQDDVNGYFRIPISASYRFPKGMVELHLLQIAPVKWSNLNPAPPSTPEPDVQLHKQQWGGLSCTLNLSIPF